LVTESDFIKNILDALENEEVQDVIRNIINQERSVTIVENTDLTNQLIELKTALRNAEHQLMERTNLIQHLKTGAHTSQLELDKLTYENNKLHTENEELKRLLDTLQSRMFDSENQVRLLSNRFREAELVYQKYVQLKPLTQDSLKRNIKSESLEEFVYSGIQYENIDSLWEFIKRETLEGYETDIEELKEVFHYFFHSYNKINPLFQLHNVVVGQAFDGDLHMRSKDSKVMGPISEIILPGYINTKTSKIIKKSIVRV
jgi:hypothetical protein